MSDSKDGWTAATRMLATHLLSIGGVILASQRTLAMYLAVTSLPQPIMPPRPDEDQPSPGQTRCAGAQGNTLLTGVCGFFTGLFALGLFFGTFFVLFRFGSQIVVDGFLVLMFGGMFTWTIWRTLDVMLCLPTSIAYKAEFPKHSEQSDSFKKPIWTLRQTAVAVKPSEWYRQRSVVLVTATVVGASIVVSAARGCQLPLIVLPLTWIVLVVSTFYFDRMSVRFVSQLMIAAVTFLLILVAIVAPISMYFGHKNAPKSPEELDQEAKDRAEEAENFTSPSAWVDALADLARYLYIIAGPGIFVALTWRFDYIHQHGAYLDTLMQSSDSKAVDDDNSRLIPSLFRLPSFYPTISIYAIGSLIVSVTALTGTFTISQGLGESLSGSLGLIIIIPLMLGTTALGAWKHGILHEWWNYSELWIPDVGDEASVTARYQKPSGLDED